MRELTFHYVRFLMAADVVRSMASFRVIRVFRGWKQASNEGIQTLQARAKLVDARIGPHGNEELLSAIQLPAD